MHHHVKNWIHIVWSTKDRIKIIESELRINLYKHISEKAEEIGIPFDQLNIQADHVHGLINLPSDKFLSDFMKKIKGESSSRCIL